MNVDEKIYANIKKRYKQSLFITFFVTSLFFNDIIYDICVNHL